VPDGDHPVADADLSGIAELDRGRGFLLGGSTLSTGDVDPAIRADQLGLEPGVSSRRMTVMSSAPPWMTVVFRDDVAPSGSTMKPEPSDGTAALLLLAALAVEEFLEQLLERRARRQLRQVAAGAGPAAARSGWW